MQHSDRLRFATTVQGYYVEIHQRPALSDAALRIWWEMLLPYELADIEAALARYHRTPSVGQYPPKPSDVIGMIEGTHADQALLEWHRVAAAVPRVGRYGSPEFGDPVTHASINSMGGWSRLCSMTVDEMPHAGRDFQRIYVALKTSTQKDAINLQLGSGTPVGIGRTGLPIRAHEALQISHKEKTDAAT